MRVRFVHVFLCSLSISCGGDVKDSSLTGIDSGEVDSDSGEQSSAAVNYAEVGPFNVQENSDTLQVNGTCEMQMMRFQPDGGGDSPLVIIAHGFARDAPQMVGWARHLSSWGIDVVTPKLCHASFTDTDHAANGTDLIDLSTALGAESVVYVGHSAGGLAAVIAGESDSKTLAVIGLDLTDADEIGVGASRNLSAPLYGLLGEPSSCNASGNGLAVYEQASMALAFRVSDADHCDFENETDALCTTFCQGSGGQFDKASIRATLLGMLTSAVVDASGLDEGLQHWWTAGGQYLDPLLESEAVQALSLN
jgi:pimeloyl-ACP methyl ester carboxylesterase